MSSIGQPNHRNVVEVMSIWGVLLKWWKSQSIMIQDDIAKHMFLMIQYEITYVREKYRVASKGIMGAHVSMYCRLRKQRLSSRTSRKYVRSGCTTALNVVPWETNGESVLRKAIIIYEDYGSVQQQDAHSLVIQNYCLIHVFLLQLVQATLQVLLHLNPPTVSALACYQHYLKLKLDPDFAKRIHNAEVDLYNTFEKLDVVIVAAILCLLEDAVR
ncbi:hypothetical protein Tco_1037036 [Tanacetum coccineum]